MTALAASGSGYVDVDVSPWAWVALVAVIVSLLVVDLLLVHRRPHDIGFKEAAIESAVWVSFGLGFAAIIGWMGGGAAVSEYLSGYLIEKTLSIDNVFVWAVIFSYFAVPGRYQHRVLFWGIFGALALRAAFIFTGVTLLERFDWILYVFGAFLFVTAIKIIRHRDIEIDPDRNPILRLIRRVVPSTADYDGQKLFTRRNGRRLATPLFVVLVLIETTDVVFAVDSIPAILAVSHEPFLVFASNALALLGMRALYFCLAGLAGRIRYLNYGLGVILAFVGLRMLLLDFVHLPTFASLGVIVAVLSVTVAASLRAEPAPHPDPSLHTDAHPKVTQ